MDIKARILALRDEKYAEFSSKLMPTVDKSTVVGVRIPELRRLAKEIAGSEAAKSFLEKLPHEYFEENNLHVFLLCNIKDFDKCVDAIDRFLPFVDNWSTCDSIRPKCFEKNAERLLPKIYEWLETGHTYTQRFAIENLMIHFLDERFDAAYLTIVKDVNGDDYYLKMMKAWYFATALAKQFDTTVPLIEENRLDAWVHNKTIQKAIESYRISSEKKAYLRTLKRK